jgi:hypothetical protein
MGSLLLLTRTRAQDRSGWLVPPGPGCHVTTSADVGSVSVSVRQDASSGHAIRASADVGSVTIAASRAGGGADQSR